MPVVSLPRLFSFEKDGREKGNEFVLKSSGSPENTYYRDVVTCNRVKRLIWQIFPLSIPRERHESVPLANA